MGEDGVTNRSSSRPPADTDAIALVIGHGKRADGGPRGGNSSILAWGGKFDGREWVVTR